jgi:hypothetical protein
MGGKKLWSNKPKHEVGLKHFKRKYLLKFLELAHHVKRRFSDIR